MQGSSHRPAKQVFPVGQMTCVPLSAFCFPAALVPSCAEGICLKKLVMFSWFFFFRESVNANILGHFTKQISYPVMHQLKSSGMTCTEALFHVA